MSSNAAPFQSESKSIGGMNDVDKTSDGLKPASASDERRLVVYIGPPKTASTSLQSFLAKYASLNSTLRENAFQNWSYPLFFEEPFGLHVIRTFEERPEYIQELANEFERQPNKKNLVIASEHLIHYDQMHLQQGVFNMFSNWSHVSKPEIVLHSRSPRTAQLISVWKQNTQIELNTTEDCLDCSFRQLMCSEESELRIIEGLEYILNPIGAANDMVHKYGLPTYFMDLSGIAEQRMDVCHAFACSILKVDCVEGNKWVRGIKRTSVRANSRRGDPQISTKQFFGMENVFLQRDCAYGPELYNHSLFHLLYEHSESWPNVCSEVEAVPAYRHNATLMLYELRKVLNCMGYESDQKAILRPQQGELKDYVGLQLQVLPLKIAVYILLTVIVVIHRTKLFKSKAMQNKPKRKSSGSV